MFLLLKLPLGKKLVQWMEGNVEKNRTYGWRVHTVYHIQPLTLTLTCLHVSKIALHLLCEFGQWESLLLSCALWRGWCSEVFWPTASHPRPWSAPAPLQNLKLVWVTMNHSQSNIVYDSPQHSGLVRPESRGCKDIPCAGIHIWSRQGCPRHTLLSSDSAASNHHASAA